MNLRVLYLFAGPRRKVYEDFKRGKLPGIDLVGLNHMPNYGIEATFLENRLTEFLRKISFNLIQLPVFLELWTYDVIFAGSGIFTLFLVKCVLRLKKPKWVIYNTYLTNLFKRNTHGLKAWVIKKAVFSADLIISPSTSQSEFLKSLGLPPEKNVYVPYGVNYDFYYKDRDVPAQKTPDRYIFSSGRDIGRDFKTLIEAVKDLPVNLVLATKPRNLNVVGELPSNVSVASFDPIQIPFLFKKAEFVVIPTISEKYLVGSDCSGQYALLTSMACGKAVITSARSTLSDYFTPSQNGLMVTPQNVPELKEAIITLWNDPQRTKVMGEAAREKVKNNFTIEIFSRKLAKIFYDINVR